MENTNPTRAQLENEAFKRLSVLGVMPCSKLLPAGVVEQGKNIWFSRAPNEEERNLIKRFEEENGGLVYYVIHTPDTNLGDMYALLYVSKYMDEWEMDMDDIVDSGPKFPMAYVYNKTDDMCSEYGIICVETKYNLLVRTG